VKEAIVVVLPNDHRLVSRQTIALQDIAGETFLGMSNTAPTFRAVIDDPPSILWPATRGRTRPRRWSSSFPD